MRPWDIASFAEVLIDLGVGSFAFPYHRAPDDPKARQSHKDRGRLKGAVADMFSPRADVNARLRSRTKAAGSG